MRKADMKKPSVAKTLFRLLRYILKNNKLKSLLLFLSIIIGVAVEIYLSYFMGTLVDVHIAPLLKGSDAQWRELIRFLIFSGSVLFVGVVASFFVTRIAAIISQKTMVNLRYELFSHMQNLSVSYFDSHDTGMIMGLYTNDLDTLVDVVSQSIPQSSAMIINILAVFVTMIITNPVLTLFVIGYVVIVLFLTYLISKKSSFYFRQIQSQLGTFTGFVEESVYSAKVIKVFSHEKKSVSDFEVHAENMRKSADKANRYANTYMPLLMNVGNLLYVILVAVGINFIVNGALGLTAGALVAFLQLTKAFTNPFAQVSQHLNSVIRGTAGANRIFTFLDTPIEENSGKVKLFYSDKLDKYYWRFPDERATLVEIKGEVVMENVNFSYDGKTQILYNLSISANSGDKIAFVGSTGAGKTTITNLLNRFYDISSGKITIDGVDIRDIDKHDLRKAIAVVLQDMHLFTGTIKENIRYSRPDASDEDVKKYATLAHADKFISSLPCGYDTIISGTDCELSEGQKQLVTIARASIAKTPILVMDEATSSVDSASEVYIQKAIDELMKGKTVFMIAHRLSTIRNADKIVVLEHGKVVEVGNHDKLISNKGRYYELYTGAAELD